MLLLRCEYKNEVRRKLIRVVEDGDPDPLRVILPAMLEGETSGRLVDVESLRGVLQRLGCSVTLWWKLNPSRRSGRDYRWVLDRGQLKVDFRWSEVGVASQHRIGTAAGGGPNTVHGTSRTVAFHFGGDIY